MSGKTKLGILRSDWLTHPGYLVGTVFFFGKRLDTATNSFIRLNNVYHLLYKGSLSIEQLVKTEEIAYTK